MKRHSGAQRPPAARGQEPAKKALATLDRERDGLNAHRDYPMTGLDNNTAWLLWQRRPGHR